MTAVVTAAVAILSGLAPAAVPAGRTYAVDSAASTLRYAVVHKLHKVDATSHRLEGRAVVQPDGRVLAMVRAPVGSFDSGDGNRDAHMQEVMETQKFPFVVFKGLAQAGGALERVSAGHPAALNLSMTGEVELHGVKRPVAVPLSLEVRPDGSIRARGQLAVSLDAHRIERPSLLFVKIDDECRVDVDLVLKEVSP